jgi:hypothetical protein
MKSRAKKMTTREDKSPEIILNHLDYDSLVPVSRSGFGLLQNTYGGGRIGAVVNFFGGISRIEYWSIAPMHMPNMYFQGDPTSAYSRCFRSQVVVDGDPYNLEFSNTHHFPFGYKSTFRIPSLGIEFLHRLTLIDDALIFSIEVVRNPRNLPVRQRFEHHDHNFFTFPERTHTNWEQGVVPNGWTMSATDRLSDAHWQALEDEKNQAHTKLFHVRRISPGRPRLRVVVRARPRAACPPRGNSGQARLRAGEEGGGRIRAQSCPRTAIPQRRSHSRLNGGECPASL